MKSNDPILITGAAGMVGARLALQLRTQGYQNLLTPTRQQMDLCDNKSVDAWFAKHRPRYAFLIAAQVGGIAANIADPIGFLSNNLKLAVNQLEACGKHGVEKCLLLGSSCIYPRQCPQPMREEHLLTGPLEPTNEGYALAKITALRLAQAYHQSGKMQCVLPMPCNIYGSGDHFDLKRCHVLSALVKRFSDAVDNGDRELTLWGTGNARREFINVDDVVAGMLHLFDHSVDGQIVNLGTGVDLSINELASIIANETGFRGVVRWDSSRPDGMLRKCLDVSRLRDLGFQASIDLTEGIRQTISEYRNLRTRQSAEQSISRAA